MGEWSALRRDRCLTTHNTDRQTCLPTAGFEPTIPALERPQTYALDRETTGIGCLYLRTLNGQSYFAHSAISRCKVKCKIQLKDGAESVYS